MGQGVTRRASVTHPQAQSTPELDSPDARRELVPRAGVILHIPHASTVISADERAKLLLSDDELRAELLRMTDRYVDELFDLGGRAVRLVFPLSRLVCDPERFPDDAAEPMAGRGMGVVYTSTSDGRPLRPPPTPDERQRLLQTYYFPHHEMLGQLVGEALRQTGQALIIDAHSFPSSPLPCDLDQSPVRPDICIGTDAFHTPEWLQEMATAAFRGLGWSVEANRPYAGTIVPQGYYRRDANVLSIMVEVNRSLYMDEDTGERSAGFGEERREVQSALDAIIAAAC